MLKHYLFYPLRHYPLLSVLGLLTISFLLDNLTVKILHRVLGIRPRLAVSLPTVFTAPLLHKDWEHFIANLAPLTLLGILIRLQLNTSQFLILMLCAVIGSGGGVWLFSKRSIVIGASGIVFAFFGFLPAYAFFTRDISAFVYGLIAVALYAGLFFSLFRFDSHISAAAHVSGLVAGVFAAWYLTSYQIIF